MTSKFSNTAYEAMRGAPLSRWVAAAMLLFVAAFSSACGLEGDLFSGPAAEGTFDKTLKVETPLKVRVMTGSGAIRLVPGQSSELAVHARIRVRGLDAQEASNVLQAIIKDPPLEIYGRDVRIGSLDKYNFTRRSITFDFDIQAPPQTEVESRSGSGHQTVEGVKGPVNATCGSGDIFIRGIADSAMARTGSGQIRLSAIQGGVEASAGSGDILAEEVKGSARARTGSGQVTLRAIGGDVVVTTGSGDTDIQQVIGSLSARAGSGNMRVESAVREGAKWEITTGSGDVRLFLPSNSEFALRARTGSGGLKVDFPVTAASQGKKFLEGVVGQAKADLSLRTNSGDIKVAKISSIGEAKIHR